MWLFNCAVGERIGSSPVFIELAVVTPPYNS